MVWLLRLAGLDAADNDRVTGVEFHLHPQFTPWVAVGCFAILTVLAWLLYRRSPEDVRPGKRWSMTILRVAFFGVLLALLLRPILGVHLERKAPRQAVLALMRRDLSGEMDGLEL